jgi:creatinine amidohydrolase
LTDSKKISKLDRLKPGIPDSGMRLETILFDIGSLAMQIGRKKTRRFIHALNPVLCLLFLIAFAVHSQENPDPNRYLQEIQEFRTWDRKNSLPENILLLVGSSSVRLWPSAASFPGFCVVNRGFGGAHISDILHFSEDVLLHFPDPLCIVFFCGSNDIAAGKSAERVFEDFRKFRALAASHAPGTPLVYIPINPCPQRWPAWKEADRANRMIRRLCDADSNLYYADTAVRMLETGQPPADSLFLEDKLHLSDKGYALWTSVIRPVVERAVRNRPDREPVLYEELTPAAFRRRIRSAPVAYLPLGTLEWHGEHLPLGADGLQSSLFFRMLAREAGGIVLPMLFMGPDRVRSAGGAELYGMDLGNFIPGEKFQYPAQRLDGSAYWLPDSTFKAVLEAIWKQLRRAGFRIVVAHGHGPSTQFVRDHADEWGKRFGLRFLDCWGPDDEQGLGIMVDHGAMNETSLVMALRPELVRMEALPADTARWPVGVGGRDPRLYASPELGRRALMLQKERMKAKLKDALEKVRADGADGK